MTGVDSEPDGAIADAPNPDAPADGAEDSSNEAPIVISVENVSKSYRPQAHQISLRQEATEWMSEILGRGRARTSPVFWALRDVSFTVQAGESIAIVGRNGSGKTTLLRVLSHVTRPTEGSVSVIGRFAALLGLNAGFNFERTGRENVYLNAAILGMHPRDVARYLDDIIAFADLGEFIDAPVKRYSTGMVARLGFSVAVHILPDIVFLDEVLAVGDAGFQEKCLERIVQMKSEGRTLLFVLHDLGALRRVCERALWIHDGVLRMDGPIETVLSAYEGMLHLTPPDAQPG